MATITQNTLSTASASVTLARTVMSASDTFTYVSGSGQTLVLFNTTASPVTVTLTNATPNSNATVPQSLGLGGTVSISGGKTVTVAASSTVALSADDYGAYLSGSGLATITGGVGITAHLYV